jgi:catechol 1,2-dioxygenase
VLITQVFADDDENLESDPTFGVTRRLIGRFALAPDGTAPPCTTTSSSNRAR